MLRSLSKTEVRSVQRSSSDRGCGDQEPCGEDSSSLFSIQASLCIGVLKGGASDACLTYRSYSFHVHAVFGKRLAAPGNPGSTTVMYWTFLIFNSQSFEKIQCFNKATYHSFKYFKCSSMVKLKDIFKQFVIDLNETSNTC